LVLPVYSGIIAVKSHWNSEFGLRRLDHRMVFIPIVVDGFRLSPPIQGTFGFARVRNTGSTIGATLLRSV